MMSALRLGKYRFPTDWRSSSAVTIATCRRYGARWLRRRLISTSGYRTAHAPGRLFAERRCRLHLGPADPVGSTAQRDLLKEHRDDHRERGNPSRNEEDVVERGREGPTDRGQDRRRALLGRRGVEDGLRVARLGGDGPPSLRR